MYSIFSKTPTGIVISMLLALGLSLGACGDKNQPEGELDPQPGTDPVSVQAEQPDPNQELIELAAQMQDYTLGENGKAAPISVQDDNILLLVNKTHPLDKNYKADDMVVIDRCDTAVGSSETRQMRQMAADPLNQLFDGAKAAGYTLVLRTGYRSYSYQSSLYNGYVQRNGQAEADRFSAKPGESEHQTGLCCDVGVPGGSLTGFNGSKEAAWLAEHAHEYGFIIRYPEGKEDKTGYMYESWHIRYVGETAAAYIYENNICLEEYLGVVDLK